MAKHWITENPFNILGILAGVSDKDLAKRKAQISAYLTVGKEVTFPEDIPVAVAATERTAAAITTAFAAIDQYRDRALHGLFWFCDGGRVDGPALTHLRAGDLDKAKEIWGRVMNAGPLTSQTLSSATNHGALCFLEAGTTDQSAAALYLQGLDSYLKAFVHEDFPTHVARVGDEVVVKNMPELYRRWVDEFRKGVKGSIDMNEDFLKKIGAAIRSMPEDLALLFMEAFSGHLAAEVERSVEACSEKRQTNPDGALEPGHRLLEHSVPRLRSMKALLGSESMEFQHASDLVAEEVLQCAIDHYNRSDDRGAVDWTRLNVLMNGAVTHAIGHRLKARVTENKETLDENYKSREERGRRQKVKPLLDQVQAAMQQADRTSSTPGLLQGSTDRFGQVKSPFGLDDTDLVKAEALLSRCESLLMRLAVELGRANDLYLDVSSAVAHKALQLAIAAMNSNSPKAQFNLEQMPAFIGRTVKVMDRVKALDMVADLRKQVETNGRTLNNIAGNVRSAASRSNSSGCLGTFLAIGALVLLVVFLLN